jgi:hypothetical protein
MEKLKIIAKVESLDEEIRYLIIESDHDDSLGYFLFGYTTMSQECEFDMWFQNLEIAKNQALIDYGVQKHSWKDFEQFINT